MNLHWILPFSVTMGMVSCGLIGKWYLWPALTSVSRVRALTPLLLLHSFRYIGLAFLIPGVTAQPLDTNFATPAAWGDLLAAILALLGILALRRGWSAAVFLVWTFNIVGTLDLLNALMKGFHHTAAGQMGSTYFIPAVIVPALLVTHILIFLLLVRKNFRTD